MVSPQRGELSAWIHDWLRARDLKLIGSVLLLALMVLAFAEITRHVGQKPVAFDERVLLALRHPADLDQPIGGPLVLGAVRDITALGSPVVVTLVTMTLIGWLLLTRRPGAAFVVLVTVAGGALLNDLLKEVFARERPEIVPQLMGASNESYPSGHTMIAAVVYPTIAELLGRLVHQRRLRFFLMGVAIAATLLVGCSRVYLGVHYPTDALAGVAVGLAWALSCGIGVRLLQKHRVFRSRGRDRSDDEARQVATP